MVDVAAVLADFADESQVLDDILAALPEAGWARATPSPGWNIAHQVGHLAWTDAAAAKAAAAASGDTAAFAALIAAVQSGAVTIDGAAAELAALPPAELLSRWREGRRRVASSLRGVAPGAKLPWFGPPMGAASMATARIMETWAHGQDITDALGVTREPTGRLRHIAHLAVRTRDFAFKINKLAVPEGEFRVELSAASGELWMWGPQDAAERVTGGAEDFCLLATRRRNRAGLSLTAQGAKADAWLNIIQAFAGPPGEGRPPSRATGAAGTEATGTQATA